MGLRPRLSWKSVPPDVAEFLTRMKGHSLINYGTAVSHVAARAAVFGAPLTPASSGIHAGIPEILPQSGPARGNITY